VSAADASNGLRKCERIENPWNESARAKMSYVHNVHAVRSRVVVVAVFALDRLPSAATTRTTKKLHQLRETHAAGHSQLHLRAVRFPPLRGRRSRGGGFFALLSPPVLGEFCAFQGHASRHLKSHRTTHSVVLS